MNITVAQMYEDLKAQAGQEKVAGAEDYAVEETSLVMDADYFNKLASGDESVLEHFQGTVKVAADEGYTDEQIDAAIAEMAAEAGVDLEQLFGEGVEKEAGEEFQGEGLGEEDEFEMAKVASYIEGANQAIEDVLEGNDLIKEGSVTADDLQEYFLGRAYGEGYAAQRAEIEEAVEKIAKAKDKSKLKKRLGYAAGGTAALAGGGALGLSAVNKATGGRFRPAGGARVLNAARNVSKGQGMKRPGAMLDYLKAVRKAGMK